MAREGITLGLVDDHVRLRSGLAEWLEEAGFRVVVQADNGQRLIENLREETTPEVMLVDVSMPVMNGFATTQWLKRNHPKVRVLAMSVNDQDETMIGMLRNGAAGYVLKDSRPDEFISAIESVHERNFYRSKKMSDTLIKI